MSVKKSKNRLADYPDISRTGSREPPEPHHWVSLLLHPMNVFQDFMSKFWIGQKNMRGISAIPA